MKKLLMITAVVKMGAGLPSAECPFPVVAFLLGSSPDTSPAQAIGRLAGAALPTLGVACWLARNDGQNRAAIGSVTSEK